MGIYDREYYRPDDGTPLRSMTTTLVLVTVGCYLLNMVLGDSLPAQPQSGHPGPSNLFDWLALSPNLLRHPWGIYELLTYGFAHDPRSLGHIVFNMIGLWCFGREIEEVYGRTEFLRIYLTSIVLAGLAFLIGQWTLHNDIPLIGASGGVAAVTMLFILHYPKRTILFMLIFPLPAWVVGVIFIGGEVFYGANNADNVSHVAHLAGAAFAFLYFRNGWNLGRIFPKDFKLSSWRPRPRLRVHDPETSDGDDDGDLKQKVDEILAKISRSGEASLTAKERRTLEQASRRYQRRRR